MENRSSDDLQVICQDASGSNVTFATCFDYGNGNFDSGILTVTETATGKTYPFFKSVLSICTIGTQDDCNEIVGGRGEGLVNDRPHVRLSGMIHSCDLPVYQHATLIVYPIEGQTVAQLQAEIIALAGRICLS